MLKSVLGKMIQHEFGKERYHFYTKKLSEKESMDIFCDIYASLQQCPEEKLNEQLKTLLDTVQTSIRISKNFIYIFMGYVVTVLTLIFSNMSWFVWIPAVSLTSICFLYKVAEYVRNRYCDNDVRIVLIYKIALFHLLENS